MRVARCMRAIALAVSASAALAGCRPQSAPIIIGAAGPWTRDVGAATKRGIELAIEQDRVQFEPLDISDLYAVEIDFAEDLERANHYV